MRITFLIIFVLKLISMKDCKKCNKLKPLNEFHKHKGRKLGVTELCKVCRNIDVVEKRYNLEEGQLQKLKTKQGNKCAICNNPQKGKSLSVDHCHKTGKNRGLLCNNCNNGLGRFKDNVVYLRNVINYLNKYN